MRVSAKPIPIKIYLAGPDVFLPDARDVLHHKKKICSEYGFRGLSPIPELEHAGVSATEIFRANCRLMTRADVGVFNLTPFRGPSADIGASFEAGLMFSKGKRLFGYTNAEGDYAARVGVGFGPLLRQGKDLRDHDGYVVEDFDLSDNLMIIRAITISGGTISEHNGSKTKTEAPMAAFEAFRICLEAVHLWFASQPKHRGGARAVRRR